MGARFDLNSIPDGEVFYAVMSTEHGLVGAEPDFESAAGHAAEIAGDDGLWYAASSPGGRMALEESAFPHEQRELLRMAANPRGFDRVLSEIPQLAMDATTLPRLSWGEVMSVSYEDAWRVVSSYFPEEKWQWCVFCGGKGKITPGRAKAMAEMDRKVKAGKAPPSVMMSYTRREGVSLPAGDCPYCEGERDPSQGWWQPVAKWRSNPLTMITPGEGLLRENHKLELRGGKGKGAVSQGLSLVPEYAAFSGVTDSVSGAHKGLPLHWNRRAGGTIRHTRSPRMVRGVGLPTARQPSPFPVPGGKPSLCFQSTNECRSSCLVHTGQNRAERYIVGVKQAAAVALLNHPVEFCRVLVEAVWAHLGVRDERFTKGWKPRKKPRKNPKIPYVRLNVFSDVPWELVFPDLFKAFPGTKYQGKLHGWYDYTKIAGRTTPKNYDLTFSYAGSTFNKRATMSEFARGRRVAVVFLLPYGEKERYRVKNGKKVHDLPTKWAFRDDRLGIRDKERAVADGDVHDIRPRNKGGIWVGLRFKSAAGISDAPAFYPKKYPKGHRWAGKPHPKAGQEMVRPHLGQVFEPSPGHLARRPGTAKALKSFIVLVEKVNGVMVVSQTPRHTKTKAVDE
jgi:hypothetical protein